MLEYKEISECKRLEDLVGYLYSTKAGNEDIGVFHRCCIIDDIEYSIGYGIPLKDLSIETINFRQKKAINTLNKKIKECLNIKKKQI